MSLSADEQFELYRILAKLIDTNKALQTREDCLKSMSRRVFRQELFKLFGGPAVIEVTFDYPESFGGPKTSEPP